MYANTANELDDGDIGTDIFTYTVSDGSLTDTGTLTITVEGINDAPVAQDDHGFINENSTLTVSNGDNATTDTTTTNQTSKALVTGATTGDSSPQVLNSIMMALNYLYGGTLLKKSINILWELRMIFQL